MSWAEDIQQVQDEAAGLLELMVVQPDDVRRLIALAEAGDPDADRQLQMVSGALMRIQRAPRAAPALCGTCPRPLRNGKFSIVIASPAREGFSHALTLAICHRCGTSHAAVERAAVIALRRIWPESRQVAIDPRGSRA